MSVFTRENRRTVVGVSLVALAVYIGIGVWAEVRSSGRVLDSLNGWILLSVFGLALVNYALRFTNWQFYLKTLGLTHVPRFESLLIFIGGFSLGITPGKVGELVRSWLLKERYDIPLSRTGSILVIDRLTDVLALTLIAGVGLLRFQYGGKVLLGFIAITLAGLITISHRRSMEWLLARVTAVPKLTKYRSKLTALYESAHTLLRPSKLWFIITLSIISWSFEAIGFWLIFHALGTSIPFTAACFIYSFSTLVGAVAFLPGGLGLTEGTLAGLLILLLQVAKETAAVATVFIRLATLWFGLALGTVCMAILELRPIKKSATIESAS